MSRHHARLHARQWSRVRRAVFDRDGWRCQRCGKAGKLEAHHEPALAAGANPYVLSGIMTPLPRVSHFRASSEADPGGIGMAGARACNDVI